MARITDGLLTGFTPSLTIDRYQEIMQLPIAAFNGLNKPDEQPQYECANIWGQSTRDHLAQWLAAAEESREIELGYHLAPKYIVDEERTFKNPLMLDMKHLVAVGVEATTDIALAETITHRDITNIIIDPVVLTVDDGNVYAAAEIAVYYPGEDVRIKPSNVTVSGTTVTVKIPRSRLVKPELNDDRSDHLYYDDDDNFLETVDIKRAYTTSEGGVNFVWYGEDLTASQAACMPNCNEVTQTGCATIFGNRGKRIASISIYPASYTGGVASAVQFSQVTTPRHVRISYLSGVQNSPMTELLTARYAHTLMPNKPCSCPLVEQYWAEDREKLDGFTTPYGNTQGALNAWMVDSRRKIGIAGVVS